MKKRLILLMILFAGISLISGCKDKEKEDILNISFAGYEFGDVDRICLGYGTEKIYVENEAAIALFEELISELEGTNGQSSRGYADGGYAITMFSEGEAVFRIWVSEKSIIFGRHIDPAYYPDRYEYADGTGGAEVYERIKQLCELCFDWEEERLWQGVLTAQGYFIYVDDTGGYPFRYNTYTNMEGEVKKALPVTFAVEDTGETFSLAVLGRIQAGSYASLKNAERLSDWGLMLPEGSLEEYIDGAVGVSIYRCSEAGSEGYVALYGSEGEDVVYGIRFPAGLSGEEAYRIIASVHVEVYGE